MTKGDRIKLAREAKNMTLEELAARCGTIKQTIYKYEKGIVTNIPSDKIEKIAEVLDVSPAYIMDWKEPKQDTMDIFNKLSPAKQELALMYLDMLVQLDEKDVAESIEHMKYMIYRRQQK